MTTDVQPRQELVLLEPRDRRAREADRAELVDGLTLPETITTVDGYESIVDLEARAARFIQRHKPTFDEHCSAAHRVWKQACEIRSNFLDLPEEIRRRCRVLMGDYTAREERDRRARDLAEAERQQAEDRARIEREAKYLESIDQSETAAAVRAQPIEMPAIVSPSAVPPVHGLSYREEWGWMPVGGDTPGNRARALGLHVRSEYLQFIEWNDAALTAFARRTKGTVRVPGVVFYSRKIPVRR
jgi:hypothetical protein